MNRWLALAACAVAACDETPTLPDAKVDATEVSAADTSADAATEVAPDTADDTSATDVDDTLDDTSATEVADTSTSEVADDTSADADVGLPACDPPLAVTPDEAWTPARRLVTFHGSGGTGAYRFALAVDASGATLNPTTGAYLSGATSAVTDEIRVSDLGCAGAATARVHVTDALAIVPAAAEIAPGGFVTFAAAGGSGDVRFELVTSASGATLSAAGELVAGPTPGTDRVRVVDLVTGEEADAFVTIAVGARLRLDPEHLFVPLGERHLLRTTGGSGRVDATVTGGAVAVVDGWIEARALGTATLALVDRHTGQSAGGAVTVVDAAPFRSVPIGDSSSFAIVKNIDDIDDDGFDDVLVALTEADVGAWDAGALYLYKGTAAGLAPEPAQVIAGPVRQDHLGRGVALGDLDRDGRVDLVVGAPDNDLGGGGSGAVFIHPGTPDGGFTPTPANTLVGRFGGDAHGHSLAICDLNGDDRLDLAVGARFAEDRTQNPQSASSGAIHVYLGRADGTLGPLPDQSVWGRLPTGANGALVHVVDLQLGWELAAGDLDGDGLCDVAATGIQYATASGRAQDGAVLVFRGKAPDVLSPGGLDDRPALAVVGNEADAPQSRLGWALAVGDLDGDARAELVVGQPYYNYGAQQQNGAVRIRRGAAFAAPAATATSSPDDLDWTWTGPGNEGGDFFGWAVALGDADGQGPADLIVGTLQDEVAGGPGNAGTVHVLPGRAGDFPDATAARVVGGDVGGQRFGVAAALIADRDADGLSELVVHAAFDHTAGPRTGRLQTVTSQAVRAPLALGFAGPAGGEIGAAALVLPDVDGDGAAEIVIGAPRVQADPGTARLRSGAVSLGAPDAATAAVTLDGFPGHSSDDRFGDALAALDFDGDGYTDLAVVASQEDTGAACSPARNNGGAVYLFRGLGTGLATTPALVYHGDQNGQALHAVAGADVDGDGLDDLVVTSRNWDNAALANDLGRNVGGGGVVRGRALGPTVTTLCAADWTFLGSAQDGLLGSAVTRLGDLDDDGCADVALGARNDDATANNTGSVRVLLGWGAACARATPDVVRLSAFAGSAELGMSAHGGVDLDGDGAPELAVGGHQFRVAGNAVGAAWIVPGAWLVDALDAAAPWQDGVAPPTLGVAASDDARTLVVTGRDVGEQLGVAVQLLPGALAVARPFSSAPGVGNAGAVSIYGFAPATGLDPFARAGFGGETRRTAIEVGASLAVGTSGGAPVLVVGARRGSALGLGVDGATPGPRGIDDGAAWVLIDPLAMPVADP